MELLELKTFWQSLNNNVIENDIVEARIVSETIHKKSNSQISKIKKAMRLKLVIGSLTGIITLFIAIVSITNPEKITFLNSFFSSFDYPIFFGSIALSISVIMFYNYKAFTVLTNFQTSSTNLKESLTEVIMVMENAIKVNIHSDAIMTPIIVTWIVYTKVFSERALNFQSGVIVLVIIPVLTFFISYFFQRFAQKLKFGNYVNRLKYYLKTLKQEKNH